jgi:NADH-quinone oxidoreductase subunit G
LADRVKLTIDGREIETDAGELLIQAAQDNGTYVPRFCWHPRMKPVGMCRMCLVEVETPRGPLLTTSCTMRVNDGMVVDTRSDTVKKAQEGILEFLLINHPLDCPVCDRGGECPLQDQTMAYGPGESRFVEEKRHYEKPIEISDLVLLDRERCILCARCTRFSDEVSGDPLIEFQDRGYGTQVLTFPDEPFSSYFSGNTVQICPVGALTARPYRFRARPWDLEAVESTCPHCPVGCRISVQSSQNQVLRFLGVDNDAVNWGWLCDKGRFGFEYIGSAERLTTPLVRNPNDEFDQATWSEAMDVAAQWLGDIIAEHGPGAVAGLGGARGTNEDAYAFSKFMRTVIGSNNVDAQLGDGIEAQLLAAPGRRATISELDRAKTILVWGPDLKEELPVLYLRVRHAAQEGAKLIVVHPRGTGLDDVATHKITYAPGQGPEILARLRQGSGDLAPIAAALGDGPVVALLGRAGYTEDAALVEAVATYAWTLDATIMPLARRSNVYGALDMGLAPTLLPGRASAASPEAVEALTAEWGELPAPAGLSAAGVLAGLRDGSVKAVILNGTDPVRDYPDQLAAEDALEKADLVIALDMFMSDSVKLANLVLPVEGFAECEGTVTNLEGRVQKVNRIVPGPGQSRPAWSILEDMSLALGRSIGAVSAEALSKEIARVAPAYAGITWDALDSARDGMVAPLGGAEQPLQFVPTDPGLGPRKARLALHLARTLYDDGVHVRYSRSLAKLAPGPGAFFNPDDAVRLGIPEGATVKVTGSAGSVQLPARIDPTLAEGTVYVPFNQEEEWGLGDGLEVRVEVVS